jgi:LacI family transcriptional regulator
MTVTIHDVAREAKVSLRTATRAINNEPHVRKPTRHLVLETAKRLGWRPNSHARNLVRGKTDRLGVVLPDSRNAVFSEIASAIDNRAQTYGYNSFVLHSEGSAEREAKFLTLGLDGSVDGLIVLPNFLETNRDLYARLLQERIPLVLRGGPEALPEADILTVDVEHGGYLATRHLLNLGHRHIGILVSEFALGHLYGRLKGYLRAHEEMGVSTRSEYQISSGHRLEEGYQAIRRLLAAQPKISALFCHNDFLAMSVFRAARELGRRIPEDLALIGFDDIDFAKFCEVPLTTLTHPKEMEGQLLADMVCQRIEQPDHPPQRITLRPELIIRESCGYGAPP